MRRWPEAAETALFTVIRTNPTATVAALYDLLPAWMQDHYNLMAVTNKLSREGLGNATARVSWVADERDEAQTEEERPDLLERVWDKKEASFDWREANKVLRDMRDLVKGGSLSQDHAHISFPDASEPIYVMPLCDTHIADLASDHDALERITDEVLSTPGLYLVLLGDLAQMAIRLRGVAEVTSNALSPDMQMAYLDSWLSEIAPRILCATWDNHAVEREEQGTGISMYAHLMAKRVPYHSGIGHVDIGLGSETYALALSHVFRGRSMYSTVAGSKRYMRMEAPDREIAMAGDSHVAGFEKYYEAGKPRLAINGGSLQLSGYAKRYFSLTKQDFFPGFVIYPDEHIFTPFWSVHEWKRSQRSLAG